MLSFDLRSLETTAARVDSELAPDDPTWEEGDLLPSDPIHVEGRLSAAGEAKFYFSGHMDGAVNLQCRRCLEPVKVPVKEAAHFIFVESGTDAADDPDVFQFDPRAKSLDMRPAVRESWLLTVPSYAQCREDCKGLCPICGTDLNYAQCGCAPVEQDPRWDALRAIASKKS